MPAAGEIIDTKTAVLIQFLKGRAQTQSLCE
jgi:hypothetical protein